MLCTIALPHLHVHQHRAREGSWGGGGAEGGRAAGHKRPGHGNERPGQGKQSTDYLYYIQFLIVEVQQLGLTNRELRSMNTALCKGL